MRVLIHEESVRFISVGVGIDQHGCDLFYRGVAQAQNAPSLEVVIRHFLSGAENAAMEAQSKSDEIVGEIEDLDEAPTAETLLLSVVSGEGARGRTDRQVVTPWLKFLWETYRTVLEILRNNPKLEHLYAYTAQQAFKF